MGLIEKFRQALHTPDWGVHPDDHKRPAADAPLRTLPLPERLYVALQQHVGAPARAIVRVGQQVGRGQLLAQAQGNISAPVHAPTSGTVCSIGELTAPHPSGLPFVAIGIASDGADRPADPGLVGLGDPAAIPADPFALPPAEITRLIAAAGIVGLGGATFPSAVKLALGKRCAVTTLIVNGGECEPYLSCDDRVMRDFPAEVIDGVRLMMHAIGAREARVGIEDNKPEAIAALRRAAAPFGEISVRAVPTRYPMGSDRQLILTLTGKEVPTDCRAADVGVIVNNVSTAHAVHRALRLGEPLIRRIVTLNGGAVWQAGNILAPVGTLVGDLLAFAGLKSEPARLVMGGPMMGAVLPHAQVPIVKGCAGIVAFSEAEVELATRVAGACIRCGQCTRACPMGLLPLEMAANVRAGDLAACAGLGLADCIACGCCAYVCPANIPLVQYFTHSKGELAARQRTRLRNEAARRLADERQRRIERDAGEKAEAAARRKAERAAQKAAQAAQEAQAALAAAAPAASEAAEVSRATTLTESA